MLKKQALESGIEMQTGHSIGTVERDTGIARDTLRIWQRRYGFPAPLRNSRGERLYPNDQVQRLQRICRLLDQGLRPGSIVPLNDAALTQLEAELFSSPGVKQQENVAGLIASLREHDDIGFETRLGEILAREGLRALVLDTITPLVRAVGESWARGQLDIYEEHIMSQLLIRFLSAQIANREDATSPPSILLGTLPGERHGIGLLMTAAILASDDIASINLGVEVPLDQLVRATEKIKPRVVGLTFSAAYPYAAVRTHLQELRERLPAKTWIWAGGHAMQRIRKLPNGVVKVNSLDDMPVATLR